MAGRLPGNATMLCLALAGMLFASGAPTAEAATSSINCKGASTIFGHRSGERGAPRIELVRSTSSEAGVEALLRRYGWERLIGEAEAVQLYRAVPGRYLVMAVSARGCHLAHQPLEESEARALQFK
ncbi:MAG: hypothetical protein AB7P52_01975 [Alphaproteobacteria bacterium]